MRTHVGAVVCLIASLSLPAQVSLASDCRAEADVKNFWVEKDGFVQKAKVRISVNSARPGAFVKVYVEADFHYERSDGWTNGASAIGSKGIDTSSTSSEDLVIDTRAVNCSASKPCQIKDVEIRKITCY